MTIIVFFAHRYYSATILQMSGVEDDRLAIWLASVTAFTNFIFTLVGVWLVEKVGRRKLTFGSLAGRCLDIDSCFKIPSNSDSDSPKRTQWLLRMNSKPNNIKLE